ncbi:TPA: type IV secretion system protein [Klebsiella pneumoniae]|uniref:type IV secretion system protein n=1 Tax=Serratia fonticola TaxID=47917 RepID=UPI0017AF3BC3|nr:conjugal transfer protein TrbJ [Escherichia coli]EGR6985876.1 conjugal transfer protein TrbJ [Salmonella enterica subsp. enterica serovar Rissen]EGZ3553178.1 conjugal transfer protein TrbJ [Salmonella enterica]HCR2156266.1 conjugal transfer protein TrbJ [Enterobacter asburiae]HAX4198998.1 conjugal transfer protein TrbJ [Escherichia coli]
MKNLKSLSVGIMLVLASGQVMATGIPTIDVAAIAKTVEEGLTRAKEAASQLSQLKDQYDQSIKYAEDQKKRLEGFTDFSDGFDSASSYMKDSLSSITDGAKSDLSGLRDSYGLSSEDTNTQARYDGLLQKIKFYDEFNDSLRERANRITSLQNEFSRADTPQKKADAANQLSAEQMTLDMQIKQYDIAERQMDSADKARQEQSRIQWVNAHGGKGS